MSSTGAATAVCADIEPVHFRHEVKTFKKMKHQSNYTAFATWARNEARKLCEHGQCTKGHCHGHVELPEWEVVEESDETFTCKFSAELFCRCG